MPYSVRFEPWGVAVDCAADQTLLDAARQAEIPVGAVCSGRGTCGKCQVQILSGPVPEPTATEVATMPGPALRQNYRLSCQHFVTGDAVVETLPIVHHGKSDVPKVERDYEFRPAVRQQSVEVEPPSLEHPVDDATSLLRTLPGTDYLDHTVTQRLPHALRSAHWKVIASLYGAEVIALRPAAKAACPLGLAVDLGTTNIAAYLHRLDDGALLGVFGAANPLSTYGADIISRLAYAQHSPENSVQLQRVLVKALNLLVEHAARGHGREPEDIDEIVVVGNSGMHHLFLNLPGRQLIYAPYVPASRLPVTIKARDLGLKISRGGYVYLPPLVGGFVGADLLAVAAATRIDQKPGVRLAIDIGTNTELLLSVNGELFSASTASGPALEGAALHFGSIANTGVIDRVWLDERGDFAYRTIKGKPAVGICGSGIVEALACMGRAGVFNERGRLQAGHPKVIPDAGGDHRFVLAPAEKTGLGVDLTISQGDVRSIQLAKGAIRAGMETLLAEHGLTTTDIDEFLIAGAFGNHIQVEAAQKIGLFPAIASERIRQIGNAAGAGASLMLLSTTERREAEALSERIHYLELATHKRFTRLFAEGQRFPTQA